MKPTLPVSIAAALVFSACNSDSAARRSTTEQPAIEQDLPSPDQDQPTPQADPTQPAQPVEPARPIGTDANLDVQVHPAKARLEAARQEYQQIADQGGWPTLEGDGSLAEGDASPEVPTLRERLEITSDLAERNVAPPDMFTPDLTAAVARAQARHGLKIDGVLGPATRDALNVPASERVAQIDRNLEHWEEVDPEFSDAYILVNVPEFTLRAYEGGEETLQMKVIVGEEFDGQATPSFSDAVEHVIFRPYWMVPHSIASEEIVPRALDDMSWFETEGYQIVRDYEPSSEPLASTRENLRVVQAGNLRLRQQGGDRNALGLVKFIFPNEHAIYLHDTPAEHLFDKADRLASHGCIRVEDPIALADFVLDNASGDWTPSRIESAMQAGDMHQQVNVDPHIPVHIMYWTVWADDEEGVQFHDDVYGRF